MKAPKEHKPQQSRVIQRKSVYTNKVIQRNTIFGDIINDIEEKLSISNIPILVMDEYDICESYDCSTNDCIEYLDYLSRQNDEKTISSQYLDNDLGGGAYCYEKQFIILSHKADARTLAHELGHAKQHQRLGATVKNVDPLFLEAHNIIVNENLFSSYEIPQSLANEYLEIYEESSTKFYRIMYQNQEKLTNIHSFIDTYYTKSPNPFLSELTKKMYDEMIRTINNLDHRKPFLSGIHGGKDTEDINVKKALTAFLNFTLENLLNKQRNMK